GSFALTLALSILAISGTSAQAQPPFRTNMPRQNFPMPQPARAAPPGTPVGLLPPQDIPLVNNGSLATWPNPTAGLPNQLDFSYFASVPLGDRLMRNGVMYDTNLIPNLNQGMPPMNNNPQPQPQPMNLCANVNCPAGMICDPMTGQCVGIRAARAK